MNTLPLPHRKLLAAQLIGVATALSAFASGAQAETSAPPDKAAFEAAIKACASSVSSDSSGRPDRQAMDQCMSAKGFTRPQGANGQGGPGNPPPGNNGQ